MQLCVALAPMGNSVLCVGNGVCDAHHNQRKTNGTVEHVEID